MAKPLEMDTDFARWYVDAFMDEGETREGRWKGVVNTAATADFYTMEVLVRYAFDTAAPADGRKDVKMAERHKSVLATISGNSSPMIPAASQRELQVLSAAVLIRLFSRTPDAAIVVLNASFDGNRKCDLPMDLLGFAKLALINFAKRKHARLEAKAFELVAPKLEFEVSPEAMASMTPPQWKGELDRLRDSARAATRTIVDGQNRVAKLLVQQMSLADEELQMLWWLTGGYSSVADAPFTEVVAPLKPLAFGYELGELTQVSPGPASAKALLSRAGIGDGTLTVPDAVNTADMEWIRQITTSNRISPVTTPLHFALEKRLEIGSDDAWLPVWASMTGLSIDMLIPAINLAELFYREYLFLHVSG